MQYLPGTDDESRGGRYEHAERMSPSGTISDVLHDYTVQEAGLS